MSYFGHCGKTQSMSFKNQITPLLNTIEIGVDLNRESVTDRPSYLRIHNISMDTNITQIRNTENIFILLH